MYSSTSKSSTSNKSSVTPDTALKGIAAFGGVLEWTCSASFGSLLTSYNTCTHTITHICTKRQKDTVSRIEAYLYSHIKEGRGD